MPQLGRKYTCYSCHTKFYDLGKPVPTCPKCGADQRDAEDAPVYTPARGRSRAPAVVEPEPVEDEEITPAAEPAEGEEEDFVAPEREEEPDDEEEEEEEY